MLSIGPFVPVASLDAWLRVLQAPRTVADHERSVPAVGMSLLLLSLSSDSGLVVLTNTGATT